MSDHCPGLPSVPAGNTRMMRIHFLEVETVEQLHRAARDGRSRALPGFGEKTELNILQAVPDVGQVTVAGSFIRQAKSRGCFLVLNTHPERLDLLDSQCRMAKGEGVLVSVNSDAHSTFDFSNLKYGVGQARRGWLEKDDVLNTRPLAALRRLLKVAQ